MAAVSSCTKALNISKTVERNTNKVTLKLDPDLGTIIIQAIAFHVCVTVDSISSPVYQL